MFPRMVHGMRVLPSYRIFALNDPTCDDLDNLHESGEEAIATKGVGWSANAVAVSTVLDLFALPVVLEVWPSFPPASLSEDRADLVEESTLEIPGGSLAVGEALEERDRLGVDLPDGGGTYGVRVVGTGRRKVKDLLERLGSQSAELREIETYRIQLWQLSTEPRWDDQDDEGE